jgi:hypothetical protein
MRNRIAVLADEKLSDAFWGDEAVRKDFDHVLGEVLSGKRSPYEAAKWIVSRSVCGTEGAGR